MLLEHAAVARVVARTSAGTADRPHVSTVLQKWQMMRSGGGRGERSGGAISCNIVHIAIIGTLYIIGRAGRWETTIHVTAVAVAVVVLVLKLTLQLDFHRGSMVSERSDGRRRRLKLGTITARSHAVAVQVVAVTSRAIVATGSIG